MSLNQRLSIHLLVLLTFGLTYFAKQYFPIKIGAYKIGGGKLSLRSSKANLIEDPSKKINLVNDDVEHPMIYDNDLIYDNNRNTVPIVNEEYNVIFFQVAKAASSEWLRFFIRLNDDPDWCSDKRIHDKKVNGLKYLSDYPKEEAQEMMTSSKWTKAIFVRHPKPRILSAFLDKAVEHSRHFSETTCKYYSIQVDRYDECFNNHKHFDFFLKEITTTLPYNVHWRSIYSRVDKKWWPYINFVGSMDNLSDDAQSFLESIHSKISGISAWDKIGKSGWSSNERDCSKNVGDKPFLAKKDIIHQTNARDKLMKFYTPELEKFVEENYADDLNNPYFHFEPIELFKDGKRI